MHASQLLLAGIVLAGGLLTGAAGVVIMAFGLLRPPRMSDGKALWLLHRLSPSDVGLAYQDVQFVIRDAQNRPLRMAGWWMPQPGRCERCVVLLHGYGDAKVGAVAWAPLWHALGFNILAMDLRAHGESDGRYCTAGYFERRDLSQVLDQLLAERPAQTRQLVLFGISLGSATALGTAAGRDDLAALVLESPPADFRSAAMAQMDRLGAPGEPFQRLALRLAERIAGCDFDAVRPVDLLGKVACPVMIIAPVGDPLVSDADRRRLHDALAARSQPDTDLWWSVDARHTVALRADPAEYERRLRRFLAPLSEGCAAHVG